MVKCAHGYSRTLAPNSMVRLWALKVRRLRYIDIAAGSLSRTFDLGQPNHARADLKFFRLICGIAKLLHDLLDIMLPETRSFGMIMQNVHHQQYDPTYPTGILKDSWGDMVQCPGGMVWCGVMWCGMLCYAVLRYASLRYAMLCYAILCCAMLCYTMLCYAMLCYAMLCYAMLCYAMLCYAMLCYAIVWHGMAWHGMAWHGMVWWYAFL